MSTHLAGATGDSTTGIQEEPTAHELVFADYDASPSLTSEESLALEYGFVLSAPEPILAPEEPLVDYARYGAEPTFELSEPYDPSIEAAYIESPDEPVESFYESVLHPTPVIEEPVSAAATPEPLAPLTEATIEPLATIVDAAPEPFAAIAEAIDIVAAPVLEVADEIVARAEAAVETPAAETDDRDAQLAQLLERISYYEAFDALIHDNISRSADLFRSLYEERERVRTEAAGHQAEIEATATLKAERTLYLERERFQTTLMSLMDDATGMQRQIDGLMQRIASAISASSTGEQPYLPVERLSA